MQSPGNQSGNSTYFPVADEAFPQPLLQDPRPGVSVRICKILNDRFELVFKVQEEMWDGSKKSIDGKVCVRLL